ncbi:MAG: Tat pathway signal protein [Crocinitomicaceae bacterium]|nr:Tat pathway signal protein [Crocinitomicaceae bacterium]
MKIKITTTSLILLVFLSCQNKQVPKSIKTTTIEAPEIEKWMWLHGTADTEAATLKAQFKTLAKNGLTGVLIGGDNESMFRAAKAEGLQAHIWLWTLNRGDEYIMKNHADWYSINRNGESCFDNPPYVSYYRWLCPTNKEVRSFLKDEIRKMSQKDYIDGIHLDYVRYCDVILPVALWEKYNLIQNEELPEFDYCYCETCRAAFQKESSNDPLKLADPSADTSWINFRYQQVTSLVNELAAIAHKNEKPISAAVFPTPPIAKKLVRQDWISWNLDRIFPMVYHAFYEKEISWIEDATREGVNKLEGRIPILSGIYMPDIENELVLKEAIDGALKGGATGISLFGKLTSEQWKMVKGE